MVINVNVLVKIFNKHTVMVTHCLNNRDLYDIGFLIWNLFRYSEEFFPKT